MGFNSKLALLASKLSSSSLGKLLTVDSNGEAAFVDHTSGFRNRLINGDIRIDQRNAGAAITVTTSGQFPVDRWTANNGAVGSLAMTLARSTTAAANFTNSLLTTITTGFAVTAAHLQFVGQNIEGNNVYDMAFGTANAKAITLSFWARSNLTGTHAVSFKNAALNRSYVAEYTISVANTFEYKTITLTADTSGTWLTDNGVGLSVWFDLGSGTNFNTAANAWAAGNFTRTSNCVNLGATTGNTLYITGVQLEVGSVATLFERRSVSTEHDLCKRYYEKSYDLNTVPGTAPITAGGIYIQRVSTGSTDVVPVRFSVMKRATPTIVLYSSATGTTGVIRNQSSAADNVASAVDIGQTGFGVSFTASAGAPYMFHYAAASEL